MGKVSDFAQRTAMHFAAYAFWGVMTTAVNIAAFFLLRSILLTPMLYSNFAAWVAAVIFAFATNRRFVFGSPERAPLLVLGELARFASSRAFSLALDMALMYALVNLANTGELAAKVAVNAVVIVVNYLTSRFLVFRKKEHS